MLPYIYTIYAKTNSFNLGYEAMFTEEYVSPYFFAVPAWNERFHDLPTHCCD